MAGPNGVFKQGSVIEVAPEEAKIFIDGHYAELIEGELPPVEEVKPAELVEESLPTAKAKKKGVKNG